MAPVFLYPLAFLGLLGVPVLLAIYLLRNRYRRVPVSSLMLWVDVRQSREGGTRVRRLQTPLLLFLEMAAVALLSLAAAGPHVRTAEAALARRQLGGVVGQHQHARPLAADLRRQRRRLLQPRRRRPARPAVELRQRLGRSPHRLPE